MSGNGGKKPMSDIGGKNLCQVMEGKIPISANRGGKTMSGYGVKKPNYWEGVSFCHCLNYYRYHSDMF
jgi:hypothetical protein